MSNTENDPNYFKESNPKFHEMRFENLRSKIIQGVIDLEYIRHS